MPFAHSQWNKFKKVIFTYIYSLKLKRKTLVFLWIPFLPQGFINSFTSERSEKELPAVYLIKRTQNQAYPLGICLQPLFPTPQGVTPIAFPGAGHNCCPQHLPEHAFLLFSYPPIWRLKTCAKPGYEVATEPFRIWPHHTTCHHSVWAATWLYRIATMALTSVPASTLLLSF